MGVAVFPETFTPGDPESASKTCRHNKRIIARAGATMVAVTLFLSLLVVVSSLAKPVQEIPRDSIDFWKRIGREAVKRKMDRFNKRMQENKPKNVIVFLGDGMGHTMVSAARIYRALKEKVDDTTQFSFEQFDFSGLSHTSSFDRHVTDSAAGAMAVFGGLKTDQEQLGKLPGNDRSCSKGRAAEFNEGVAELAVNKGLSVGFVTTTSITDATPGSLYAKGVFRGMEYDGKVNGTQCTDIASQVLQHPANKFKVLMGGGNSFFLPTSEGGKREDGRNLHKEWLSEAGATGRLLKTPTDLAKLDIDKTDRILGTFAPVEFTPIYKDSNGSMPRLADMARAAVKVLRKDNENGFFLMVEGGLIDYGEHYNNMHYACEEMLEMDDAIQAVMRELGDELEETLLITTADHSHAFSLTQNDARPHESLFGGHQPDPIISKDGKLHSDYSDSHTDMPTVLFASGPGYRNGTWYKNYTRAETEDPDYAQPAAIGAIYGAHGGEDVGVWTHGPFAWLFSGSLDNTQIAYNIKYLLCLDPNEPSICDC